MDVVALQAAKADAKRLYALEIARRRLSPLPSLAGPMAAPPTRNLTKANGASAVAIASGGTGYAVNDEITLAGGTTSFPCIVKVSAVTGGVITAATIARPGAYSVTPTNPAPQASTTGTGTGATFTMTYTSFSGSCVRTGTVYGPTDAAFRFLGTGPANIAASGYYGSSVANDIASVWEWATDAPNFDIRILGFNCLFTLYVDGVRVEDFNLSTDSSGASYVYCLDFGTAVPRTFRLQIINSAFGGLKVPTTASVWKPNEPRKPFAWALCDSYGYGTGADAAARAAMDGMAEILRIELLPDGIGGTGWNNTGATNPVTRINNRMGALTRTPDYVFFDLGFNNAASDLTLLATNFDLSVAAVRTLAPAAKIIVFGPATPVGETPGLLDVKTTISGRCAVLGVTFINVSTFITANNKTIYTGADATHPNQAGHDYLAARKAQAVAALL